MKHLLTCYVRLWLRNVIILFASARKYCQNSLECMSDPVFATVKIFKRVLIKKNSIGVLALARKQLYFKIQL